MNGNSETIAEPTVDSGWGYCTDDCKGDRKKTDLTKPIQSGVGVWSTDYLQITNIDVLQGADCLTMCKKSPLVPHPQVPVRGINSTKVMDLDKQVDLESNSFIEKGSLVSSLLTFTLLVSILLLLFLQCLIFQFCTSPTIFPLTPSSLLLLFQLCVSSALRWPQDPKETPSLLLCLLRARSKHDFPQTQISFEGLETSTLGGKKIELG